MSIIGREGHVCERVCVCDCLVSVTDDESPLHSSQINFMKNLFWMVSYYESRRGSEEIDAERRDWEMMEITLNARIESKVICLPAT